MKPCNIAKYLEGTYWLIDDIGLARYGIKSVVSEFLQQNPRDGYAFYIHDFLMPNSLIEVQCDSLADFADAVNIIYTREHASPLRAILVDDALERYIVTMSFTKGVYKANSVYKYSDGKLEIVD